MKEAEEKRKPLVREIRTCIVCNEEFLTVKRRKRQTCPHCKRKAWSNKKRAKDKKPLRVYEKTCVYCLKSHRTISPTWQIHKQCKQKRLNERMAKDKQIRASIKEGRAKCIICGFPFVLQLHHEKGKAYILCPNHHQMIHKKVKTLGELIANR